MSETRRHDSIAYAILALVPTLFFADILLGFNSFYARDVASYYYPAKKILREIVLSGHFPYWNHLFSAGQPMAANPEHEVFYPLTWIILLPNFRYAFHLLVLVHVYLVTFTMYALLRDLGLGHPAAVFGALSFSMGGLIASTLNLFPYLFSLAWFPLTCLYTRRFLLTQSRRAFALAAFFLGMQLIIGEPTTAFQSGLILGMYALYRGENLKEKAWHVLRVGAISMTALAIAAVQVLPTIDHFGDSVRARGISYAIVSKWSTPLQRLGEIFYPHFLGYATPESYRLYFGTELYSDAQSAFFYSIYSGLAITVLAFAGLVARVRGAGLFLAIGVTSVLLAAGDFTPLLRILYDLGIAQSSRYPEKFTIMGVFALVVFGAKMLDELLRGNERVRRASLIVAGAVTAFAAIALLLTFTPVYEPAFRTFFALGPSRNFVPLVEPLRRSWLIAAASGLVLLILMRNVSRMRATIWMAVLAAFTLFDVVSLVPELAPRMPSSYYDEPRVLRHFPPNRDEYRIFHFANWGGRQKAAQVYGQPGDDLYWIRRNDMPPIIPATYGLRTVHEADYDLTGLLPTEDFTKASWELSRRNPRVWLDTVTAMSNIWFVGVHRSRADALALAKNNPRDLEPIRWLEGKHHPRYYFADQVVSIRDEHDFVDKLATNRFSRGAAFVAGLTFTPARGVVHRWQEWPNGVRLDVEAAGRAYLVMSVTPHKHWRVTIDGDEAALFQTNIGYQGMIVGPGRHTIEMSYRNPVIAIGGAISLVALLALLLYSRR